ncbi:MAG TPA: PrsW family glutamic-type intramembrane protease [Pseudolysinimonas sp.]|jgi:RsiW-degrading membrane proteinase PrsW (M82 family)|nr:PrsW family glutamic-type intramembrane protease [Pseudolysinimonas sp.]
MASASDDTPAAKKPAAKKPAATKPAATPADSAGTVSGRPAATRPVRPGKVTDPDAKPVGKQAQAAAYVAEQEAKNSAKPIAPTASPLATVVPAGNDTPRSVRVTHTPESAPSDVSSAASDAAHPVFLQPVKKRPGPIALATVGLIVVTIAVVLIAAYFLLALGPTLTVIGGVLALIPLAIVLLGIRWIDRWEPEPRTGLIFAFLWGAGVAVLIALVTDYNISEQISAGGGATNGTIFLQTVFQAPIVEEFAKGLGVLLIFIVGRRFFDGPVDGIVYAATIAGGFAFTENIQYFGLQIAEAGGFDGSVGEIFFVRGILSPFAHVMFTSMTGLLIGLAARRGSVLLSIGAFFVGLIPAILLHMFWNGALFFVYDFYGYYLIVQVPLFGVAVLMVFLLRRREARMTQVHLQEYANAGWLNASEVTMLGTPAGRRHARSWARRHGLRKVMNEFIRDATHLAFTRNRIVTGRDRIGSQKDEQVLLYQVAESRRVLSASQPRQAAVPAERAPVGPPAAS